VDARRAAGHPARVPTARSPLLLLLLATLSATACAAPGRARARRPAPPPAPYALYRGEAGTRASVGQVVAAAGAADLVVIGEVHDHPEGSLLEREMFSRLAEGGAPISLAMEFFERDQQPALDAWRAGTLDEAAFRKATNRSASYEATHAPLLALAKERGLAVLAANAPRRLVTAWRTAETDDYAGWLAGLPEADRALLPRETSRPRDAYWERFRALMGGRAERFYRAQSLWDDAMAESIADHRAAHPDRRVLLVVGGFHVARRLGTVSKFLSRRPSDRVVVVLMSLSDAPSLPLDPSERGDADWIAVLPHHATSP
jgi:uncharacterized iron-regulated protein